MSLSTPSERVLSTLNTDGSRFWIRPKLSPGRFLTGRRVVGYALILLFIFLPRIRIGGRPAFLIDLVSREISIAGAVFRPSDGFLLMLLGLTVVITVFFVTALWGRVWCGWGCPQTVYLEHVFRPIERLWEGSPSEQRKLDAAKGLPSWRRIGKWVTYVALSFALANVFLAYFVGTDRLEHWVFQAPTQHLFGFGVVMFVTALMVFNFTYFREQTCIVACPYGRLQSVMVDKQSLIIAYDSTRGEPRGKSAKKKLPVVGDEPAERRGDCIDCGACVTTCPTGIDIRNGLQMECIGCAQCIDACDHVMDKIEKPRGLIRYTSEDELAGKPRKIWRLRTFVYPALLALVGTLFVWNLGHRAATEVWVQRPAGPAFFDLGDGKVAAQMRIKLENKTDVTRTYRFTLVEAEVGTLRVSMPTWTLGPGKRVEIPLFVDTLRTSFSHGQRKVHLRIDDDHGWSKTLPINLIGPEAP